MKNETIYKIIEEYKNGKTFKNVVIKPVTNKINVDNLIIYFCNYVFNTIPQKTKQYLITGAFRLKFLNADNLPENFKDNDPFSYTDINKFTTYIVKPKQSNNINTCQYIIGNLLHEIGHYIFIDLIVQSYTDNKIKDLIKEFKTLNFCSPYAEKYFTKEYGKNFSRIYNIERKFHENFAEYYRLYYESLLDLKYNSDFKHEIDPNNAFYKLFLLTAN